MAITTLEEACALIGRTLERDGVSWTIVRAFCNLTNVVDYVELTRWDAEAEMETGTSFPLRYFSKWLSGAKEVV